MASLEAILNTVEAIPAWHSEAWTANMISRKAKAPRMQMREAEKLLEHFVSNGEVFAEMHGYARCYKRPKPRNLRPNG
jgi:hypothetical protein